MDKTLFSDPPMAYRSVPFWSWNGTLMPEETRWQVRELTEKGFGGDFLCEGPDFTLAAQAR